MIALGIVLLVLLAIGMLPVGVWVQFDRGELALKVKAGAVAVPILPKKPPGPKKQAKLAEKKKRQAARKAAKKAEKEAKKAAEKENPQKKPKKKLDIHFILSLVPIGLQFLGGLRRKLYLPELTVYLCMGGGDAAAQAEGYGKAWAILGAATPVLENTFRIGKRDLQAMLDWSETGTQCFARAEVRIRIGGVIYLALRAGVQFLKALIQNKMQNKKKAVQTT